jgi:RecA-family ATPase
VRVGNWPKRLRLYRFDGEIKKRVVGLGDAGKIEVLGTGQQFVAYAMHPDTKAPFEWITTASPLTTHSHDLTVVEMRHLDMFVKAVEAEFPQAKDRKPSEQSEHGHIQADERWALHISNIIDGSELHDSIRALAAGWVRSGMPPGAVVQALRAIVGQSAAKTATPDRWMERYSDIPRSVSTAQQEFPFEPPPAPRKIERVSLARLRREEAPTHRLALDKWLPARKPSVMHADGGIGKTRLALQLCVIFCTGDSLMGMHPSVAGTALFASAEEDEESIWTILDEIATGMRLTDVQVEQVRNRLHVIDLTREASPILYDGKGWTSLGQSVLEYSTGIRPVLSVLDNASSCYAGPATEAAHIYALLNGWTAPVQAQNGSGLVLLHENKTALRDENRTHAYGGIVAWNNAPRARLELTSDPHDDDARYLKLAKGNYQPLSARKEGTRLVWSQGAFMPEGEGDHFMENLRTRGDAKVVYQVVAKLVAMGNTVSPSRTARNNPLALAKDMVEVNIPAPRFWRGMERCISDGSLIVGQYQKSNRQPGQRLELGAING